MAVSHIKRNKLVRYFVGVGLAILLVVGFVGIRAMSVEVFSGDAEQQAEIVVPAPPTVDELLRLVNEERTIVGVKPLVLDPLLNQSAQLKAEDMVVNNYFDHVDANGKHGYQLISDVGKVCIWQGENIWQKGDEFSAQMAITAWKGSKPHYDAMVGPDYETAGFGIAGDIVVHHFCDEQ